MHGSRNRFVSSLSLLAALAVGATAQDTPGYVEAAARYKECIGRLPFRYHVEGREKIAQTRDANTARLRELRLQKETQAREAAASTPPKPVSQKRPNHD